MMPSSESDQAVTLAGVQKALRGVGRIPRVISIVILMLSMITAAVPLLGSGDATGVVILVLPAVLGLVLAFRVRATLTDADRLVIRGYLRTSEIDLEHVDAFVDCPYEGWWNGFSGTDGWTNLGLRMMDVELVGRRGVSLPETLTRRRSGSRLAELLNAWADQRSPLSERRSQV